MVLKKIIFQNRYVELETPLPFMEKTILNFHFDYLNTSLRGIAKQLLDHLIYQHHLVSPLHICIWKMHVRRIFDKVRTRISQQSTIQLFNIRPLDSQQDFFEQSTRFLSSVKNISQDNQKYRGR